MSSQSGGCQARLPLLRWLALFQTSNGEERPRESSSASIEQPSRQLDDESASSGAPDGIYPIIGKVDVGLPPDFDPRMVYTWEGINALVDGQLRGLTWNPNAFFMGNKFYTQKKHSYLLRKFEP